MAVRVIIKFVSALLYGCFVFAFVDNWSFDYNAVVNTVEYFQSTDLTYFEILAFNSFSTYILAKQLSGYDPEFITSIFYGFCALLRFFAYSTLLPLVWFVPIFASMAIMLDFNTSRYSLAITIIILIFGIYRRQRFMDLGVFKTGLISIAFFHLHHFSVVFLGLFSRTGFLFRTLAIFLVPVFISFSGSVFSRFLSSNGEPFPRIALVYFGFAIILTFSSKIRLMELKVVYSVSLLVIIFYVFGLQFNSNYFTRFSFVMFDVILLIIALNTWAIRNNGINLTFNIRYVKVFLVCFASTVYQSILIGGNIWRFF